MDRPTSNVDSPAGLARADRLERGGAEATALGVRARIAGLAACGDLTILEIDFVNPPSAPGHCPATSTFVHHLRGDRSATVDIYYHTG
jgi:hypothetical protein